MSHCPAWSPDAAAAATGANHYTRKERFSVGKVSEMGTEKETVRKMKILAVEDERVADIKFQISQNVSWKQRLEILFRIL